MTFNVHEIPSYGNPRGNYGTIVNSFNDQQDAISFACAQFTACKGNFAVSNGLSTVFDTRQNYGEC